LYWFFKTIIIGLVTGNAMFKPQPS